jgi:hypothetical protein
MSTRFEWTHADWTQPTYISPGHRVDGWPVEVGESDSEAVTTLGALVLSYDEAFVVEGTLAQLRNLIDRILDALPPDEQP